MQTCGLNFFCNNSIRGMELERLSKNQINPNGITRLTFLYFYFCEKLSLFNTKKYWLTIP